MKARLLAFAALVVGVTVVLFAQLAPDAPVIDFRLPGFNNQGNKIWEIHGAQARYVNENRIEVTALDAKTFLGDEAATLDMEITSPLAIVQRNDKIISGPGQVRAVGRGWEIFGDNWTYDLSSKTVVIRKNVVVTIGYVVGDILK